MFKAAGMVMAVIDDVKFAEPKFAVGANDFDICVHVTHAEDPAQADWWRGEVSQNYGKANFATLTQAQITMQTLRKVGFEGNDLTTLKEQIVGKQTPVMIKTSEKDGKIYHNVQYIGPGGGDHPQEIDETTMKARIAALFGGAADDAKPQTPPSAPAAPKQKTAPDATRNPFGNPAATGAAKPNPFAPKTAPKPPVTFP